MAASRLLDPGTVLAGRYAIERLLGRGGMGAVYLAADRRLASRRWAVKEMWPDALEPADRDGARARFEREALLLAQLEHPWLPRVTDYFTQDGRQYLVMELVEGQTLESLVEANGPVDPGRALHWGLQIGELLTYLHERPEPIILRDLKPGNVMVTPSGAVKVIDFGIARIYQPGKAGDTIAMGTPGYAPPEQYGRAQSDARVDVYALGATLHYALTGHDPGDTPFQFDPITLKNPAVSPALDEAIRVAVRPDAAHRYPTAQAMSDALRVAAAGSGPTVAFASTTRSLSGPLAAPPAPVQADPTQFLAAAGVVFAPPTLTFGAMRRGEVRRMPFQIRGTVEGSLGTRQRWLRADPHRVRGTDPCGEAVVYTSSLAEGRDHHAAIILRTKQGEALLPVHLRLEPARMSVWSVVMAVVFTLGSVVPLAGLLGLLFMALLYVSCPLDERPSLRPFMMASAFFATVVSVLSGLGLALGWLTLHWLHLG